MNFWKKIKYFNGYLISKDGLVISLHKGGIRLLKHQVDKDGYHCYTLFSNSVPRNSRAHRLVADAWIKNPNNHPQVNHINGIKDDNRVENLEWCTSSYNQIHARTILKSFPIIVGEDHAQAKLKYADVYEIIKMREAGVNPKIIAKQFSVSVFHVYSILKKKKWGSLSYNIKNYTSLQIRGDTHPFAKLKTSDVISIRKEFMCGYKVKDLVKKYKTSDSQIRRIINNESWSHI